MRRALPPACSISSWHRSNSGLLRASSPTRAPLVAKPMASRLPIPRPAPVISTVTVLKECTYLTVVQIAAERSGLGGTSSLREFQFDEAGPRRNVDALPVVEHIAAGHPGKDLLGACLCRFPVAQ